MFSIDQLLAPPPLSALFSILLIAGFDLIGAFMLHRFGFINSGHMNWIRWQAPIVGAMFFAIFLYPLALAHLTSRLFMQAIASICITAGAFQIYRKTKRILAGEKKLNTYWKAIWSQTFCKKLLLLILFGMGLVAMGPPTNADSLDNHLGVAIDILNKGGIFAVPEWFHARLTGNGEVLNAMAMSVGAEQFGSLLQYASLLGLAGIILLSRNTNDELGANTKSSASDFIALAAFSAPVLLFLVSSSKPQMWPIAMTTFAFALVAHPSRHNLSRQNALIGFGLVCLLVMTASQAKFNYMLGGGVVGMLAISVMAKQRYFWESMGIGLITATLIFAPPVTWKAITFNTSLIDALIHPLPGHWPGTDAMIALSQFNADWHGKFPFPLSILIPSSFGAFGVILGIGGMVLIGIRPGRDLRLWSGICASVIVVITNVIFAPPAARMYLEPYFWLLFILAVQENGNSLSRYGWLKWPIYGQAFLTSAACWFGVVLLFPGALSPVWRTHIMERSANGYEFMQWADSVLPKNAVLLNGHRSMALSPRNSVSSEWLKFVDLKDPESHIYLDILKSKKVSHIFVEGKIDYSSPLSNCFGKVFAGPGFGHKATRNPFNKSAKYEAWILVFESNRLPECAVQDENSRR